MERSEFTGRRLSHLDSSAAHAAVSNGPERYAPAPVSRLTNSGWASNEPPRKPAPRRLDCTCLWCPSEVSDPGRATHVNGVLILYNTCAGAGRRGGNLSVGVEARFRTTRWRFRSITLARVKCAFYLGVPEDAGVRRGCCGIVAETWKVRPLREGTMNEHARAEVTTCWFNDLTRTPCSRTKKVGFVSSDVDFN